MFTYSKGPFAWFAPVVKSRFGLELMAGPARFELAASNRVFLTPYSCLRYG